MQGSNSDFNKVVSSSNLGPTQRVLGRRRRGPPQRFPQNGANTGVRNGRVHWGPNRVKTFDARDPPSRVNSRKRRHHMPFFNGRPNLFGRNKSGSQGSSPKPIVKYSG
uniref:Amino acid transporter transmembrane domain-containing protein n=1 Tax=Strongyloides stercoralis TaxID=6248 RepID=A0AAF5DCW3_STRER